MRKDAKSIMIAFAIIVVSLALMSCGGNLTGGTATFSGAGTATHQSFDDVYGIIENNIDAFSPREVVRLRAAGETLDMVADLPELIPLYKKARIAYIVANDIIMSEIDEFKKADQLTLYAFQETCTRFDTAIVKALNSGNEDNPQLVKDIVVFLTLVGKIALPLML
jgi:hypothetical protein